FIIYLGGFLLEAKAFWGHTCIAGGLFVSPIQIIRGCLSTSSLILLFILGKRACEDSYTY
ncbi:hypothetical protein, partial [Butyrivibrio sp. INlla21]|uniref:hypothetical protein n=1 Tax=Butyrivibrio sp. INlla21 TaxID=1520811 RepID=UPI001A9A545B